MTTDRDGKASTPHGHVYLGINMTNRFALKCNKAAYERVRRAHWELSRY